MPESSSSPDKDAKKIANTDIFLYLANSRHYVVGGASPQIIRTYITIARSLGLLKEKNIPIEAYDSSLLPGERTAWYARHRKLILENIATEIPTPVERTYVIGQLRKAANSGKRAADLVGLLYECGGNSKEADEIEDTFTDANRLTKKRYSFPSSAARQHKSDQIRRDRS